MHFVQLELCTCDWNSQNAFSAKRTGSVICCQTKQEGRTGNNACIKHVQLVEHDVFLKKKVRTQTVQNQKGTADCPGLLSLEPQISTTALLVTG